MSRKLHRFALSALAIWAGSSPCAEAKKFSVTAGFYSLSAKTATSRASLSGIGSYQLAYEHPFLANLDLRLGYSLLMTKGIGGDLAFGFDVGANYYPLTRSSGVEWSSEQAQLFVNELWRPYLGAGFFQRSFQSLQSGFAGFGGWVGVDRAIHGPLSGRFEGRYLMLAGPKSSSVTQLEFSAGISVTF